jgi:hypothetical protein
LADNSIQPPVVVWPDNSMVMVVAIRRKMNQSQIGLPYNGMVMTIAMFSKQHGRTLQIGKFLFYLFPNL